jgi:hypothetical protein
MASDYFRQAWGVREPHPPGRTWRRVGGRVLQLLLARHMGGAGDGRHLSWHRRGRGAHLGGRRGAGGPG